MAKEMRVAGNKIAITGVIKEHKLKEQKGEKGKYINGSLVIKAGEFKEIEVKVFVDELTKEKKVKKTFSTLKDIIDKKLPTMVDDKENPTAISIYGNKDFVPKLKEERYANQTKTDTITKLSCELGFGSIKVLDSITEEDFKATFDIEMFVVAVEDELNKEEEETGRVKIKGYVPTYGGGIFPMEVIAGLIVDEEGEYNFAEDVKSDVSEGDTINVWGDINFEKIVEKKSKGGKLGRAKTEDVNTYINEFVAIGADFLEDDNAYEEEDIEKAVKERKIQLEEVLSTAQKEEDDDKKSSKGKGMGSSKSDKKDGEKVKREINF